MNEYSLDEYIPLIREVVESGGEFRMYPRGTSMLPLLRQGKDSVALVKAEAVHRGDILLYQRANGQYVLHRVVRVRRDGTIWFSGDNHLPIEKGIAFEQIIASVSAVFRDKKRKSSAALKMRIYAILITIFPYKAAQIFVRRVLRMFRK